MNFRNDIQGLRGIAVLLVLFYHLYPQILSGGFIGVDIFFVISGFLVCYSIENRIKTQKNKFYVTFYSARLRRLLPASLLTVILVSIYTFIYDFTYFSVYKNDAIASLLIFANYNFYFHKVDYFHAGLKESTLLHYWSLSLEEQFYIISPIIVWSVYNHIKTLYIVLSVVSFIISLFYGYSDLKKAYFFLSSRSWEFLLGALIRYIPYNSENKNKVLSNVSIILLIVISVFYSDRIVYPSYNALIPVMFSLSTLYSSQKSILITNRVICVIGNLSYSIYLIHFPLKTIINTSIVYYFGVLIICVIISYNVVEIPFYRGRYILSNNLTYIISIILISSTYILIIVFNKLCNYMLKDLKHYSSPELVGIFVKGQKNYCCLKINSTIYQSAILFIGDSHIEQYMMAIINSEYKDKYQLIHMYLAPWGIRKDSALNYIKSVLSNYHFNLCVIGMYMYSSEELYSINQALAQQITSQCNRVLLSNDNPRHTSDRSYDNPKLSNDPNSCLKINKNDCYGVLNQTCIIPDKHSKPNNSNIEVVTFWENSIIEENKCLFYYNDYPIYADYNHLSVMYMRIIHKNVVNVITKYIGYDKEFKYNSSCPYFQLPRTSFLYKNIYGETCV